MTSVNSGLDGSEEAQVGGNQVDNLREKLAAIEHERWADWQKWMHSKGEPYTTGADKIGLLFRQGYIDHLERQIVTPYSELSDQEKASDMEQVDRYWPLIEEYLAQETNKARLDEILMMQAVGDAVAAKPDANFEELSGAYDNHILKRAAGLTEPKLTVQKG